MSGGAGHAAGGEHAPGFLHDGLLYESPDELVGVGGPFLLNGLAAGDAAVIAAGSEAAGPLRDAVGNDPRVLVVERHALYRSRTPTAISAFRRLIEEASAGGARRVRVLGEVDFGLTRREWLEWQRYESVINQACGGWAVWALCVFDTRQLPGELLESARRTHPQVLTLAGRQPNPEFTEPAEYLRALPVPAEPLQATRPRLAADDVTDFIGLRHAVRAELATVDGPDGVIEDFLLAVDEMTTNALRHGRPPVGLHLWTSADRVVCTISDRGGDWDDPFAGYGPAHGEDLSHGGMGLWLARTLCDHVDIQRGSEGVTVRLTSRWG